MNNIFFQPHGTTAVPADSEKPRRWRHVTNSPAEEYAARPGSVEALPDSSAALFCSYFCEETVGRAGISIDRRALSKDRLRFWSPDSVICETRVGEKVTVAVNRLNPDCVHALTPEGGYIETIPLAELVPALDSEAAAKALADKKRAIKRDAERLADLHAGDTRDQIDRAGRIADTLQNVRVRAHFPADDAAPRREAKPSPVADRIAAAQSGIADALANSAQRDQRLARGYAEDADSSPDDFAPAPRGGFDYAEEEDAEVSLSDFA